MTSYTRKLYSRDPAAALAAADARKQFDVARMIEAAQPRMAQFDTGRHVKHVTFGRRQSPPSAAHACTERCGHPACAQGCVLFVQQH